jgi:hypothetical protein
MGAFKPIFVPPNASIAMGTKKAIAGNQVKDREFNDLFIFTSDANLRHTPKYYVRLWNVSEQDQTIERGWVRPGSGGKLITIPAKEPGAVHGNPFVIPDIVQMPVDQAGNWELGTRGVDGKFLAQDAINPEDMRGNWRTVRKVLTTSLANEGTNLYHWGCFWDVTKGTDLDSPIDPEMIRVAVERLEDNYNRLIDEANLFALDSKTLGQISQTHRRAANYFGRSFTWNIRYEKQNACPNCGHSLPVTASRCFQCKRVLNLEAALREGTLTRQEAIESGMIPGQVDVMAKGKKSRRAAAQPTP